MASRRGAGRASGKQHADSRGDSRGNFDAASQMLGRPYAICGRVVTGDQIGHELGFPTANLDVTGLILPPDGVYAASTKVQGNFIASR